MTIFRFYQAIRRGAVHQNRRLAALGISLLFIFSSAVVKADPLLNGVATHSELGKDQFIAGLFVSTLSDSARAILSANEDKRLQVRVLAPTLSTRRFKRMWIEGMAINSSPDELKKHAENLAKFSNFLRVKMIEGDILSVDRSIDGLKVGINGTIIGEIDDPGFFDLLLRTWIGPVPLSSDFRTDLLSEGNIKPGPLARFESTRPSDERIAAIEQAVGARAAVDNQVASTQANQPKPKVEVPKPQVSAPKTDIPVNIPDVAVAAPEQVVEATPRPTPPPKPQATPTPVPKIVLAPKQQELDESIFEEDDGAEFTAESLLREQLYYSQLAKFTHRFLKYPQRSWDKGEEGTLRVRVTIDRTGKVKDTELLEESQYNALNNEAKNAVKRASPYPAIPSDIGGDEYNFTFRVAFKIPKQ